MIFSNTNDEVAINDPVVTFNEERTEVVRGNVVLVVGEECLVTYYDYSLHRLVEVTRTSGQIHKLYFSESS